MQERLREGRVRLHPLDHRRLARHLRHTTRRPATLRREVTSSLLPRWLE
jgi:hypothetical protein